MHKAKALNLKLIFMLVLCSASLINVTGLKQIIIQKKGTHCQATIIGISTFRKRGSLQSVAESGTR